VAQEFDTNDLFANAYDDTNRPIQYAARYTWVVPADGIPIFRQVANTQGPIGQWIVWPKGTRVFGQWGQVFPAKMAGEGPDAGKVFPYKSADILDPQLGGLAVDSLDGSALTPGASGLVVAGTDLGAQQALFFPGGAGSVGGPYTAGDMLVGTAPAQTLPMLAARAIGLTRRVLTVDTALNSPIWKLMTTPAYAWPASPPAGTWPAPIAHYVPAGAIQVEDTSVPPESDPADHDGTLAHNVAITTFMVSLLNWTIDYEDYKAGVYQTAMDNMRAWIAAL